MKFRFHPEAEAELESAYDYYEAERSGLGRQFGVSFTEALQQVIENPESWAFFDSPFRIRRLKRFPYGIVYEFESSGIVIVSVMHLHRRPGHWKSRLSPPQSE